MKVLEFENTQGIMLQYANANVLERSLAFIIDFIIILIIILILRFSFKNTFASEEVLILLVLMPVFVFYTLLFELLNDGKSPGKMIIGIRVIRIDGKPVRGYDYAMRWLFRWLDIYISVGCLAAVMVGATPRSQRMGDLLADTTVIRIRHMRVPLLRVLSLNKLADHVPVYPGVVHLREEQVVLVKETLERASRYNNEEHRDALLVLANKVATNLGVELKPNAKTFLQTVIRDYIALTR